VTIVSFVAVLWRVFIPQQVQFTVWEFSVSAYEDFAAACLFPTDRSVYLLLWDLLGEEEGPFLETRLQAVHAKAPNAPVILVGTHLDQMPRGLWLPDRARLARYRRLHPNVEAILAVSCTSRHSVRPLVRLIKTGEYFSGAAASRCVLSRARSRRSNATHGRKDPAYVPAAGAVGSARAEAPQRSGPRSRRNGVALSADQSAALPYLRHISFSIN
jgi:hypothetical protein